MITKTEALTLALAGLLLASALWLSARDDSLSRPSLASLPPPAATLAPAFRLDPNLATAEALTELPGIGETLAERIVQQRRLTPIDGPEDLLAIEGIGEAKLAAMEPYIIYEGGTP